MVTRQGIGEYRRVLVRYRVFRHFAMLALIMVGIGLIRLVHGLRDTGIGVGTSITSTLTLSFGAGKTLEAGQGFVANATCKADSTLDAERSFGASG